MFLCGEFDVLSLAAGVLCDQAIHGGVAGDANAFLRQFHPSAEIAGGHIPLGEVAVDRNPPDLALHLLVQPIGTDDELGLAAGVLEFH